MYGEFSGILSASPLDVTAVNNSTTMISWSVVATTAAVANQVELVIECDLTANVGKGGSSNTPTGYTQLGTNGSGSSNKVNFNYKIRVKSVGTESVTVSGSAASIPNVSVIVATFKAVPNVIQQTNTVVGASSTTTAVTVPLAGNTGILAVCNASGGASTVTPNCGTPGRKLPDRLAEQMQRLIFGKRLICRRSASGTITFGNACVSVYTEIFGLSTTVPLDKSVTANGSCGAGTTTNLVTGTTATTSNNPQIAIAALGCEINGKSGTWSSLVNGG